MVDVTCSAREDREGTARTQMVDVTWSAREDLEGTARTQIYLEEVGV